MAFTLMERRHTVKAARCDYADDVQWTLPPDVLTLDDHDVQVWRIALDEPVPARARVALSESEEARAGAFRFAHLTTRFVAAHAALRAILSRYTGVAPHELAFSASKAGKPSLGPGRWPRTTRFNMSHSGDLALVAVAETREVGIDVECMAIGRTRFEPLHRFFSPAECTALGSLDPSRLQAACYRCWTRKEAFLKARGDGLTLELGAFDVSCGSDESPQILARRGAAADNRDWSIFDLDPGPAFTGAGAIEGPPPVVRTWQWTWVGWTDDTGRPSTTN
jgi:4'-phosphopantetheinyl transferase